MFTIDRRAWERGAWALAACVLGNSLVTFGWCASVIRFAHGALFLLCGLVAIPLACAAWLVRERPLSSRFGTAARVGYFVLLAALGFAAEMCTIWALLVIFWGRGGFVD